MPEPRSNPPRRSLFAVWRWPRWAWGMVVVMLFPAYLLSAAPVDCIVRRTITSAGVIHMIFTVYEPAWQIIESYEVMGDVVEIEMDAMEAVLGPEQSWGSPFFLKSPKSRINSNRFPVQSL